MVASSAASAAAAAADLTRRGEAFGADVAAAARAAIDTAIAHSQSSASAAASAASSSNANALAALPSLTLTAKEELEWVKNEYSVHEQMVLGKIKEGVIMSIEHQGIAAGSAAVAGIVLFKSPRSYLIQRVRHIFVSKESMCHVQRYFLEYTAGLAPSLVGTTAFAPVSTQQVLFTMQYLCGYCRYGGCWALAQ
ncbi:hypothetical protein GUJ93_ZPchr0006g41666 [Zizania palustris]|uniref:Uncharacterized protein n=1 Tax=Zizania palustris TaxID=103762 RepID=A0A8J5TAH2_ZIZPA|nr:hypothetical protein GUJ93_ZPchr0006g41666 [Zizania palustris]